MRTVYLGQFNKPDGYGGDIVTINAVYDVTERKVLAVHPLGSYVIESKIFTVFEAMDTFEWMLLAFHELN